MHPGSNEAGVNTPHVETTFDKSAVLVKTDRRVLFPYVQYATTCYFLGFVESIFETLHENRLVALPAKQLKT